MHTMRKFRLTHSHLRRMHSQLRLKHSQQRISLNIFLNYRAFELGLDNDAG